MNNEPVAWMVDGVLFTSLGAALNISFDIEQPCIPLYTHPVKEDEGKVCAMCGAIAYDPVITQTVKELTDELLMELYEAADYSPESYLELARAILRKAQEK